MSTTEHQEDSASQVEENAAIIGTLQVLQIEVVRMDLGTQSRAALDPDLIDRYAEEKKEGAKFPASIVYYDGSRYILAGGFHRTEADKKNGLKETVFEVRQGSLRDAVLCSLGENADHGLARTVEEKRAAVMKMLSDPEWSEGSDTWIGIVTRTSQPFVGKLRKKLITQNVLSAKSTKRRGRDNVVRETANIGRKRKPQPETSDDVSQGALDGAGGDTPGKVEPPARKPWESSDVAAAVRKAGGRLSRLGLEQLDCTGVEILSAVSAGAVAQLEFGIFTLPGEAAPPSPTGDQQATSGNKGSGEASGKTVEQSELDEILDGRMLAVSFVWMPGLNGFVSISVNATTDPQKASREVISNDKVPPFPEEILQMITRQLGAENGNKSEAASKAADKGTPKSTKKNARRPPSKAAAKKKPVKKAAAKRATKSGTAKASKKKPGPATNKHPRVK